MRTMDKMSLFATALLIALVGASQAIPPLCNTNCQQKRLERDHHASLRRILDENRAQSLQKYAGRASRRLAPNPDDLQALTSLYKSTGGANWTESTGWKEGTSGDPCGATPWHGISCNDDGRVVAIELVYNNLVGRLPADLVKASNVEHLVFYSNLLAGPIPNGLLDSKNLIEFDVNNNAMSGRLPDAIDAPKLQSFVLYANEFSGSLPSRWNAPSLQYLDVSDNQFTGSPPEAIGELEDVVQLVVSRNNLTGEFPTSWGHLTKLEQLWSFNNDIRGPLPESWSALRLLENVEIDGILGVLPDWLGTSWTRVQNLLLPRGNMSGSIPASICHLERVEYLWLFQNNLTGSIPDCMGKMVKLQSLELSDNRLSGSLPESLGELYNVSYFYASRNRLNGSLPESLSRMKALQVLDVSSNMITGGIPASYVAFTDRVYSFAVCYNSLSGPVPASLERFFKFIDDYTCDMYGNPWSCPVPGVVPKSCGCQCSECNTGAKRQSCAQCVASAGCGFCANGPNCIEGSASAPASGYECPVSQWTYGSGNC